MRVPTLLLASAALAAAQIPFDIIEYVEVEFDPIKYDGTLEPCVAVNIVLTEGEKNIPAELAYACLDSVPVDVEGNQELIEELKLLWQFQSDIAWLQTPPDTYELGPTDLIAELDDIKNNLDKFPSEYAVQLAIWAITIHTGNFHFNYVPDILQVFKFERNISITAISDDGKAFPKVYVTDDAIALHAGAAKEKYSPLKSINGEEVYKFLENVAARSSYIDLDGQLNALYWKGSHEDSYGSFFYSEQYQGGYTNITFENGTTMSHENTASTTQDFEGVVDGLSFYLAYCTGAISGFKDPLSGETKRKALTKRTKIPTEYYPTAIAQDKSNSLAGYFLKSQGYQDTAVLKIISFDVGETVADFLDYQATLKKFLAECVKSNKKKLIIDLRENGGGSTNILLDTVIQLFPKDTPFSAQHNRVHEIWAAVADSVEEMYTNAKLKQKFEIFTGGKIEEIFRDWSYWIWTKVDGTNFKDMEDFAGPFIQHDDLVTSTWRYNLTDVNSVRAFEQFKFTDVKTITQPFAKENIVMLTDALCGSACSSFHEELKNIVGIKSVVVGGRPRNGPMQAVTGTKGGEVRPLNTIPYTAVQLINITENIGATTVLDTYVLDTALVSEVLIRAGNGASRVQFQEQIRKGDPNETPLQFIYEAADCKFFYTLKTLFEPEETWKAAWNAFTDEKNCVSGSTRHSSSISGGFKPYGSGPLKPGEMGTNTTSRATLTSSARPSTYTAVPNISTLPIVTRIGNGTATRPAGTSGTVPATSTRTGPVIFTGAAAAYGPGGVIAGVAMGAVAALF